MQVTHHVFAEAQKMMSASESASVSVRAKGTDGQCYCLFPNDSQFTIHHPPFTIHGGKAALPHVIWLNQTFSTSRKGEKPRRMIPLTPGFRIRISFL